MRCAMEREALAVLTAELGPERARDLWARVQRAVHRTRGADPRDELYWLLRREHPELLAGAALQDVLGLCPVCGGRVPDDRVLANGARLHDTCRRVLAEVQGLPPAEAERIRLQRTWVHSWARPLTDLRAVQDKLVQISSPGY